MISLTLDKARISRATLLRLISAVGSAAVFGMLTASLTPAAYWPSAFALAFIYGFFFVGGTGYRILIAVAFQDTSRKASASWSGATTATALAALTASLLIAQQESALLVIAAYAAAINFAYIPVKFACLEAGCCQAQRRDPFLIRGHDLRRVEIAASVAVLSVALTMIWIGAFDVAAILGVGGHLAIRLLSRWSRNRLPGSGLEDEIKGQELLPLALLLAVAIWMTAVLQS
ncbi:hypothetical protein IMCC20628_00273 [Hoeflea sp. IMCC20628]|uniref:hypothetical protein n=1 Tax=Hoeflea sp. IMCC20628 TaxID=1620421 RepID=UPI00063AF968|nr:hypothetical protein [Hoeflea sp. IMCC20628]AKH99002.1 hypothetical protein IMCC20628_00273 [Hoeflea sp. IMCC20628]